MRTSTKHALLLMALSVASCGSGETCVGGLVTDAGECIAKCDPALCVVPEGADGGLLTDGGVPVNACVNNTCMLRCGNHRDCTYPAESCRSAVEDGTDGGTVNVCQNSPTPSGGPVPAGLLESCADGECPDGLLCVGKFGDADAYCALPDCTSDDQCPGGFFCGVVRDPHEICGSSPTKGNNAFCGTTSEPCIDPSEFSDSGPLREGSFCILRNACLKRTPCAPCTTDMDCAPNNDTDCIDIGGEKHCAAPCNNDSDCPIDQNCDNDFCVPKFGACHGAGEGFCDACFDDRDCGAAGSGWICEEVQVGQRACLDTSACASSAECPNTPLGPQGTCYPGPIGLDGYLPMCYPYATSNWFTCW